LAAADEPGIGQGDMTTKWLGWLLILSGCAYQNPNIYTYGWRAPALPDPDSRSFVGYDPAYEQTLIDQYIATHQRQVEQFRAQNGLGSEPE
jgi:hypothetical protein